MGSPDLVAVFGDALAPLIVTCIRVMYLGVMGWIGSVLTIRGVQLVTQLKREPKQEIKPVAPTTMKTQRPTTTARAHTTSTARKTSKIKKVKAAK